MSANMVSHSAGPRGGRGLAISAIFLSLASLVMVVFTVTAAAAYGSLDQVFWPSIATAASIAVVGGLIGSRRPRELIGWLLLFVAVTQGMVEFAGAYAHLAYANALPLPAADVASWIGAWMWMPGLATMLTFVFLLFPDGHLPSPRWRVVAVVAGVDVVVLVGVVAISSWSYRGVGLLGAGGPPPGSLSEAIYRTALLVVAACIVASFASSVARYRRADVMQRHQLKWFLFAAAVVVVGAASSFITVSAPPAAIALQAGQTLGTVVLPIAIAVAVFRYRLYDIDVVISRTIVYGSLAVFITGVYVGIAVGIGAAIGGGGKPNLGLSILATAIVAVGFQPVRERLQKLANRLVYGKRATPYEVLSQFSERVAESYSVDEVMPRMARVLAEGTGAQRADVWVRRGSSWNEAAVWPEDALSARELPALNGSLPPANDVSRMVEVRHQGDLLGALSVTKRPGEALTPVEENLLTDLAGQAGLVMRNVGLTSDLQARVVELRASRQRLVTAQDEERRRLERNLHDGAQQHLVALKVKLGLADMLMGRDPEKAKATLAQLKGDADEALETLRDLARGIYPPLLADKGLVVALESQARKATVPVTVEAEHVERYPQDLEAAVYFCCLEALQNVQKYAKATHAVIRLRGDGTQLHFEVADDGAGFDTATVKKGSGLTNMVDRLDALGGVVDITSAPGQGSTLRGSLPVPVDAVTAA